jgi:hypothetical protein
VYLPRTLAILSAMLTRHRGGRAFLIACGRVRVVVGVGISTVRLRLLSSESGVNSAMVARGPSSLPSWGSLACIHTHISSGASSHVANDACARFLNPVYTRARLACQLVTGALVLEVVAPQVAHSAGARLFAGEWRRTLCLVSLGRAAWYPLDPPLEPDPGTTLGASSS